LYSFGVSCDCCIFKSATDELIVLVSCWLWYSILRLLRHWCWPECWFTQTNVYTLIIVYLLCVGVYYAHLNNTYTITFTPRIYIICLLIAVSSR
jgi:hypothetical protein